MSVNKKFQVLDTNKDNLDKVIGFSDIETIAEEMLEKHNAITFKLSRLMEKFSNMTYSELHKPENLELYDKVDALHNAMENISWRLKDMVTNFNNSFQSVLDTFEEEHKSLALKYFIRTIEYLESNNIPFDIPDLSATPRRIILLLKQNVEIYFYPQNALILSPLSENSLDTPNDNQYTNYYYLESKIEDITDEL